MAGPLSILRDAARAYLRRVRARRIAQQYHHAYAKRKPLGSDFEGWEAEGIWPDK